MTHPIAIEIASCLVAAAALALVVNGVAAGMAAQSTGELRANASHRALSAAPTEPASLSRPIRVTVAFAGEE